MPKKYISYTELQQRLEQNCPKCGPNYHNELVHINDDHIVVTYECDGLECNHIFGRVKFIPEKF